MSLNVKTSVSTLKSILQESELTTILSFSPFTSLGVVSSVMAVLMGYNF